MKRIHSVMALSALVLTGAGCAANPLVGQWQQSTATAAGTFNTTLNLDGNGTASMTITGSGTCTGMQTYQGITWSSAATTITFSGTASCSGMITCMVAGSSFNVDCSMTMNQQMNGACNYTLSGNNNSLTISNCSNSSSGNATTFTRAGTSGS